MLALKREFDPANLFRLNTNIKPSEASCFGSTSMTKALLGIILGLLIGVGCRLFDIPVPSPPKLLGALLVVAMTVGYMATDRVLDRKVTGQRATLSTNSDGSPSASAATSRSQK